MEVPSLKPQLGVELFRLVLLRESYLKRLHQQLKGFKASVVDIGIIGLIDLLRETSIEVVEAIGEWEEAQVNYPDEIIPFTWNKENYLEKMKNDLNFLADYPVMKDWLSFELQENPFIVPPDLFELQHFQQSKSLSKFQASSSFSSNMLQKDSYVIFGSMPDRIAISQKQKVKKLIKSPYMAPIINDPEVFANLSAKSKLDKQFKTTNPTAPLSREGQAQELEGLYQCYLSSEVVMRIQRCLLKLYPKGLTGHLQAGGKLYPHQEIESEEGRNITKEDVNEDLLERDDSTISGLSSLPKDVPPSDSTFSHLPDSPFLFIQEQSTPLEHFPPQNTSSSHFTFQNSILRQHSTINQSTLHPSLTATATFSNDRQHLNITQITSNSSTIKKGGTQIWSTQDINFQRQVERRGGELFILTVAGTKGRMLAPKRRTRYERLVNDLSHLSQLSDQFGMMIEDLLSELLRLTTTENDTSNLVAQITQSLSLLRNPVQKQKRNSQKFSKPVSANGFGTVESNPMMMVYLQEIHLKIEAHRDILTRLEFTNLLYHHYQLVTENGKITTLESERQRHQLSDGQTREKDQLLSIQLEEKMMKKIQVVVRRAFGRALRKAEIARRNKAAIKIQCCYRMSRVNKTVKLRMKQLRLALMVQRLYRVRQAAQLRRQLQLEALQRSSALLIQRAYRGSRGRRRLQLKRVFIKSIMEAKQSVSLVELKPSDIETLADVIDDYIRDYTISLPLDILTILRGILYLFNGDSSECVIICNDDGYQEMKYIHPSQSSWQSLKLILRRKGRFLRRLRSLIQNTCLPNPSRIVMSEDARHHLKAIYEGIKIDEVTHQLLQQQNQQNHQQLEADYYQKIAHGVRQLHAYLMHVYVAFTLQDLFPEYFEPGLPSWFRTLMKTKESHDRADIQKRINNQAAKRIEDVKRIHAREGKRYKHISNAVHLIATEVETSKQEYSSSKRRFSTMMKELAEDEQKQIWTLEAIVRAKSLARDVSEGDLKEYMKGVIIPDEVHVKSLQYTLDAKTIALIQSKTELIVQQEVITRNQSFRDFDKLMSLRSIYEDCITLGKVKGDLMMLYESWNALLNEIGGVQYVKDLIGERKVRYDVIEKSAHELLEIRRQLVEKIEEGLLTEYAKVYAFIYAVNQSQIGKKWDRPSTVEAEHEESENRECCRRDYEMEFRKRRQLEIISLKKVNEWIPMMIILDAKLPHQYLSMMQRSLCNDRYRFKLCQLENIVKFRSIEEDQGEDLINHAILQKTLQEIISEKENILLVAHRGFHTLSALLFDHYIESLVRVLIPCPRVAMINAESCFQANPLYDKLQNQNLFLEHPFLLSPQEIEEEKNKTEKRSRKEVNSTMGELDRRKVRERNLFLGASRVTDVSPTSHKLTKQLLYSYDLLFGKVRKLSEYLRYLLITTAPSPPVLQSPSSKANSAKLSTATSEGLKPFEDATAALFTSVPSSSRIMELFEEDFQDFLTSIKLTVRRIQEFQNQENILVMKDLLLAMNLAVLWKVHSGPYRAWDLDDIKSGAIRLRIFFAKADFTQLCEAFSLLPHSQQAKKNRKVDENQFQYRKNYFYEDAADIHQQLLDQEVNFRAVWKELFKIDFYKQPFRYLLVAWISSMRELIALTSTQALTSPTKSPYHFYWNPTKDHIELFLRHQVAREIQQANIFKHLLAERKAAETMSPIWKFFYNRDNMDSISQQSLGTVAIGKGSKNESVSTESGSHVVIYHNGDELYIELSLWTSHPAFLQAFPDEKARKTMQQLGLYPEVVEEAPHLESMDETEGVCRLFTKIHANDFITLIQPNYTEIFEGNVKKGIFASTATQKDFYNAIMQWVCLDCIGGQLDLSVIRARYLVLSRLGNIAGYFVRLEVYEERFGELQVLVFGLDQAVLTMQQAYKKKLQRRNTNLNVVAEVTEKQRDKFVSSGPGIPNEGREATLPTTTAATVGGSVIYQLKIRRNEIQKLISHCDEGVEKDKLEALDSGALAYIFTDRLEISPSINWYLFLSSGELIPRLLPKPLELSIRLRNGPGRLVGSKLLNLRKMFFNENLEDEFTSEEEENREKSDKSGRKLRNMGKYHNGSGRLLVLLTIYEINTARNLHELRISLFHFYTGKTAEYRLSSMERMMLFKDFPSLIQQIINRVKLVYCNIQLQSDYRTFLPLPELQDESMASPVNFEEDILVSDYEIEGEKEYAILTTIEEEDEDDSTVGSANDFSQGSSSRLVSRSSGISGAADALVRQSMKTNSKLLKDQSSDWQFALYFDRSSLSELYGNLQVSVVLNTNNGSNNNSKRGCLYVVYDPRSFHEVSRFFSFRQMAGILHKNMEEFDDDLQNLDESNAYDIIDDCLSEAQLDDHDQEGLILYLQNQPPPADEEVSETEKDGLGETGTVNDEVFVIARLRQLPPLHQLSPSGKLISGRGRRREKPTALRLLIEIVRIQDLARLGAFGSRNPLCIVRFNMREIGRTNIMRNTIHPVFDSEHNNVFTIHMNKDSMLATCSIEIEVFDTDARGKTTDYLGHVKLQGDSLFSLLDEHQQQSRKQANLADEVAFELQRSKRISDQENRHVKGTMFLKGQKKVLTNKSNATATEGTSHRLSDTSVPGMDVAIVRDHPINPIFKSFALFLPHFSVHTTLLSSEILFGKKPLLGFGGSDTRSLIIVVYFNHQEIYRSSHKVIKTTVPLAYPYPPSTHLQSLQETLTFYDINPTVPLECRIPEGFPITLCELDFAVFLSQPKRRPELIARTKVTGLQLKGLLRHSLYILNGSQPSAAGFTASNVPVMTAQEVDLTIVSEEYYRSIGKFVISYPNHTTSLGRLSFYPSLWKPMPLAYRLVIRSGRNLPKADLFGKSDPFVKVFLNGQYVGETNHVNNTINPNWIGKNEEHNIILPLHQSIEDNVLEFQVYDYDQLSENDLLGVRILTGKTLKQFLNIADRFSSGTGTNLASDKAENAEQIKKWKELSKSLIAMNSADGLGGACEYSSSNKSVFFTLQKSPNPNFPEAVSVRGDIEVAVLKVSYPNEINSAYPDLLHQKKDKAVPQNTLFEAMEKEITSVKFHPLEHAISSMPTYFFRFYVVSAKGLANADLFGKSDPFAQIWFNGIKVGTTKVIQDSLNPVWNESFELPLARGQSLETCYLQLELYDEDNHQQSEFLGSLFLDGMQLVELLAETHINRDLKLDQYSFLPFYELQILDRPAPINPEQAQIQSNLNKYVKGSIQIGMERVPAEDRIIADLQRNTPQAISPRSPRMEGAVQNREAATSAQFITISREIEIEEPRSIHDRRIIKVDFLPKSTFLTTSVPTSNLSHLTAPSKNAVQLWILLNQELWYVIPGRLQLVPFQPNKLEIRWFMPSAVAKANNNNASSITSSSESQKQFHVSSGVQLLLPDQTRLEENFIEFRIVREVEQGSGNLDHPTTLHYLQSRDLKTLFSAIYTGFSLINLLQLDEEQRAAMGLSSTLTASYGSTRGSTRSVGGSGNDDRWLRNIPLTSSFATCPNRFEEVDNLVSSEGSSSNANPSLLCICGKKEIPHNTQYLLNSLRQYRKPYKVKQISTTLENDEVHWSYFFEEGENFIFRLPGNAEEEKEVPQVKEPRKTKLPAHLAERTSMLLNNAPLVQQRLLNRDIPAENEDGTATAVTAIQRKALESSAMDFTLTIKSRQEEEHRIYWRGKFVPKQAVFTNEKAKQAILASRSSRLVRTRSINDMEIMADVHYLVDFGDETMVINDDLPICVREVVSEGPGLIRRIFRLELLTNTGILLGTADILDQKEDMLSCVGKTCPFYEQLNSSPMKDWNLQEIFFYIAEERLIFDMMSTGEEKKERATASTQRREAIVSQHAENADLTAGSVISIIRDDDEATALKKARAKREAKRKKQKEEAVEAPVTPEPVKKELNFFGFKAGGLFGTSKKKSTLPPLQEDKEEEKDKGKEKEKTEEEEVEAEGEDVTDVAILENTTIQPPSIASVVVDDNLEVVNLELKDRILRLLSSSFYSDLLQAKELFNDPSTHLLTTYKKTWIRMYSKTQRITGKSFRCIIFLSGIHETFLKYYKLPGGLDSYFRNYADPPNHYTGLHLLMIFLCCVDSMTKKVYEIHIPGKFIANWLMREFQFPNLDTKFRRNKFGNLLCSYLSLTYLPNNDFKIQLLEDSMALYPRGEDDDDNEEEVEGENAKEVSEENRDDEGGDEKEVFGDYYEGREDNEEMHDDDVERDEQDDKIENEDDDIIDS